MENERLQRTRRRAVNLIEDLGLTLILLATLVAGGLEVSVMVENRTVTLADLLLLFIYLEVVAMVHAYWQSGQLPVRMPMYIAMVALARYLILEMKGMDELRLLAVAGAILLLSLAVLLVRYGHFRFPYGPLDRKSESETAGAAGTEGETGKGQ